MKQWKTHKGKTLATYREGNGIKCKFTEGGELPPELQGIFTSDRAAEICILRYLDRQTPVHAKGSLQQRINSAEKIKEDIE